MKIKLITFLALTLFSTISMAKVTTYYCRPNPNAEISDYTLVIKQGMFVKKQIEWGNGLGLIFPMPQENGGSREVFKRSGILFVQENRLKMSESLFRGEDEGQVTYTYSSYWAGSSHADHGEHTFDCVRQ